MKTEQRMEAAFVSVLSYFSLTAFTIAVVAERPELTAGWAALCVAAGSLLVTSIRLMRLIKKVEK